MDSNCSNKLNTFLAGKQKDTTILKEVVSLVKRRIPQQAGLELFQKWSDIYDYNKTLPDSLKISVLGIDKSVDDKSKILRDSAMMTNFSDIIKRKGLENESFYGFFGLFHVLQDGVNSHNAQSFAARAKKEGFNIKSIVCLNIDSEVYMPKNDQFPTPENEKISFLNMDGPIVLAKGIKDLKEASKENTITLFNLEQENSPYRNSQKLITNKTNFINQDLTPYDVNSVTTDFFQYVAFLRNAKAITPIK